MVRVAREPLAPVLDDDRHALTSDLTDHRSIVQRRPLPASSLLRRMPRGRQADELKTIITAEVDIADVRAERWHDVLDNGAADRFWIERAGQRRRQLLKPPRSLLAAASLRDVAIRLEHEAPPGV